MKMVKIIVIALCVSMASCGFGGTFSGKLPEEYGGQVVDMTIRPQK